MLERAGRVLAGWAGVAPAGREVAQSDGRAVRR